MGVPLLWRDIKREPRRRKLYGMSNDAYPMYCTITCNIDNYYNSSSSCSSSISNINSSNTNTLQLVSVHVKARENYLCV